VSLSRRAVFWHAPGMRLLVARALVVVTGAALALVALGASCGGLSGCPCNPCDSVINFSVTDDAGTPLTDDDRWVIEVTVNGQPIGQPAACTLGTRTDNTCAFGTDPGIYEIVVRGAGFTTVETVARFPERTGNECCGACTRGEDVAVKLSRVP
jgi:hypothetical protein